MTRISAGHCFLILNAVLDYQMKVSNCGMSDAIGPVHIKERPSSELQSRIDAEVCVFGTFGPMNDMAWLFFQP